MLFYLDNKLKITKHSKIKIENNKKIEVNCDKNKFEIIGENLVCKYYSKEELLIQGNIERIYIYHE